MLGDLTEHFNEMENTSDLCSSRLMALGKKYFVTLYFCVLLLIAGFFTLNEYAHLTAEKDKLVSAIKAVEGINFFYPQAKEKLLARIALFDISARDDKTLQSLQQRFEALNNEIKSSSASLISAGSDPDAQDFYKNSIENELLTQEREYLTWLQQLVLARKNSDSLHQEAVQRLDRHKAVYGKLQANEESQRKTAKWELFQKGMLLYEHAEMYKENHQAAVDYQDTAAKLQREVVRAAALQSLRGQFAVDETRTQARVMPLYVDIYQMRETIKRHWITKALKPSGIGLPLAFLLLFAVVVTGLIANIGLGYFDQRIAKSTNKPSYLLKMIAASAVIFLVPVILVLINSSYERAKIEKAKADIRAKIEQAETAEKKVIASHAAELAEELLNLRANEGAIKSFSDDMRSWRSILMALSSTVEGKEKYTKRATDSFYKHIISGEDLHSKWKGAVISCEKDIEAIENEFLVSVGPIDFRYDANRMGGLQGEYEISSSVERVADKSRWGNLAVATATVATFPFSIVGGLVADLLVDKLVADRIEDKVKEEITTLSVHVKSQFGNTEHNYLLLRNTELRNQLGV